LKGKTMQKSECVKSSLFSKNWIFDAIHFKSLDIKRLLEWILIGTIVFHFTFILYKAVHETYPIKAPKEPPLIWRDTLD
jgi:hypothetical protein